MQAIGKDIHYTAKVYTIYKYRYTKYKGTYYIILCYNQLISSTNTNDNNLEILANRHCYEK